MVPAVAILKHLRFASPLSKPQSHSTSVRVLLRLFSNAQADPFAMWSALHHVVTGDAFSRS